MGFLIEDDLLSEAMRSSPKQVRERLLNNQIPPGQRFLAWQIQTPTGRLYRYLLVAWSINHRGKVYEVSGLTRRVGVYIGDGGSYGLHPILAVERPTGVLLAARESRNHLLDRALREGWLKTARKRGLTDG